MTSSGYSGTPLPKKLGIKPGHRVMVLNAPAGFALDGVDPVTTARGLADVILSFHTERRELEKRMPVLRERMQQNAALWISWPKKASGKQTDLTETQVRGIGLAAGLVDVKVCAVDETWSGLKFVYRLKDR